MNLTMHFFLLHKKQKPIISYNTMKKELLSILNMLYSEKEEIFVLSMFILYI